MRILFILLGISLSGIILAQQTSSDSIPRERKRPSINSRGNAIERPYDFIPDSKSSLEQPMRFRNKNVTQPTPVPKLEKHAFSDGLTSTGKISDDEVDPWGFADTDRFKSKWYRNITGFRAFVNKGVTIGFGKHANSRLEWMGAFGYQFNPIFFVGVGQGYCLSLNNKSSFAPTYVNPRVNFLDENITPFLDFKLGYSFLASRGLYVNPTFGMSFGKHKSSKALNIGVGYSYQTDKAKIDEKEYKYKYHGVSLRMTYEFKTF